MAHSAETIICMVLKAALTASENSHDVLPASKSSKKMKGHLDMPMAKPIQAIMAPTSPVNLNASMDLVPPRSFQNSVEPSGFPGAIKMRLNSTNCNGTVMLPPMYLYTIGDLCTWTQYSHAHPVYSRNQGDLSTYVRLRLS